MPTHRSGCRCHAGGRASHPRRVRRPIHDRWGRARRDTLWYTAKDRGEPAGDRRTRAERAGRTPGFAQRGRSAGADERAARDLRARADAAAVAHRRYAPQSRAAGTVPAPGRRAGGPPRRLRGARARLRRLDGSGAREGADHGGPRWRRGTEGPTGQRGPSGLSRPSRRHAAEQRRHRSRTQESRSPRQAPGWPRRRLRRLRRRGGAP